MKLLGYQPVQDYSTSSYIISPETEIIRSIPQPAAQLSYVKFDGSFNDTQIIKHQGNSAAAMTQFPILITLKLFFF